MKKVNEYVEMLRKDTRAKIRERMSQDERQYKELLKNLLIQGLIKLMEPTLYIRCRKSDL